jgi:hypothetical protein
MANSTDLLTRTQYTCFFMGVTSSGPSIERRVFHLIYQFWFWYRSFKSCREHTKRPPAQREPMRTLEHLHTVTPACVHTYAETLVSSRVMVCACEHARTGWRKSTCQHRQDVCTRVSWGGTPALEHHPPILLVRYWHAPSRARAHQLC